MQSILKLLNLLVKIINFKFYSTEETDVLCSTAVEDLGSTSEAENTTELADDSQNRGQGRT
jgi:hypothetical protein